MNKQKIKSYLQSMVAVPLFVMAPLTGFTSIPSLIAINSGITIDHSSVITSQEDTDRQNKADVLDAYFASYDSPLEGYGMKFVTEAEKNDIDWRLLPAIAMRESTGGKNACKKVSNSVFGYGSCKLSFKSIDESIEIVSASLGGNNPNTARHYAGKTTVQILKKYNPDSIIPGYSKQVIKIMKSIDDTDDIA
ncbi:MAG: hypothetical protein WCK91_02940 [bacterium]